MKSPINLQAYKQRHGHDIDGVRPVMIPSDDGMWFSRSEVEHAFHRNGMIQLSNKLEAAERDELRAEVDRLDKESQRLSDQLGACDRERREWINRANKAEAELARRDAATGSPAAEIKWDGTDLTVQNVKDWFSFGVTPVYTTPPAASVNYVGEKD